MKTCNFNFNFLYYFWEVKIIYLDCSKSVYVNSRQFTFYYLIWRKFTELVKYIFTGLLFIQFYQILSKVIVFYVNYFLIQRPVDIKLFTCLLPKIQLKSLNKSLYKPPCHWSSQSVASGQINVPFHTTSSSFYT